MREEELDEKREFMDLYVKMSTPEVVVETQLPPEIKVDDEIPF